MIPAIILGWFRTNPRNVWLIAGLVGAVALLGFVYLKGRGDNARAERARDAVAVQAAIKSDTKANDKAAEVVAHDAMLRVEKEKELIDAVAEVSDGLPDPVAVRLGCERLRQANVSVADLPACRTAGARP